MKFRFKYLLPIIFLIFCFLLIPGSAIKWSASGQFNATPDELYVNWTTINYNGTITLGNNISASIILNVSNSTSNIKNSTFSSAPFSVYGWNGTNYTYTNNINMSSLGENVTTLIFDVSSLAPGRYNGNVTITNYTNATDNINITVTLDVPINVNASNIGTFSGNVTNSTSEIYYFNVSNITNVAGMEINFTVIGSNFVNFTIYNSTESLKQTNITNSTTANSTDYIFSTFPSPAEYWKIYAISNNTSDSTPIYFNGTIELKKASLRVNNSFTSENITLKDNLGINRTDNPRQISFYINNTADYDLTIQEITNSTNLTKSDDSSKYMPLTFNIISVDIPARTGNLTNVNITINTINTNNTGLYKGWIFFNTTNGYPYKTFNLSLIVDLTHELDTTLSTVTNNTGGNYIIPGLTSYILVNVTPKYQNGTAIPNFETSNFLVSAIHQNVSSLTSSGKSLSPTLNSATYIPSGPYYTLNLTLGSTALGGIYKLLVNTTDNNTNNLNYGNTSKDFTVNETALKLDDYGRTYCVHGQTYSLTVGNIAVCEPRVTNYGYKTASGVNVSYSLSSACIVIVSGSAPSTIQLGNIAGGGSNDTLLSYWTFNASSAGSCTLTITTNTSGTVYDRQTTTINYNVSAAAAAGDGGATTTTTTATTNTTTALSITDYPTEIKIEQGKEKIETIKVKNTGAVALTSVSVSVSGINETWWAQPSAKDIAKNAEKTYNITFSIPGDAEVKSYPITFKAAATGVSKTVTSNLIVLPSAEMVNETILPEFENLTAWYTNVSLVFNQTKAAGGNVSLVEAKLNETRDLLDNASAYIEQGDYYSAYQLFAQIKNLLNTTETDLIAIKEGLGKVALPWTWIAIVVAAIACVIIIIYVSLPRLGKLKIGFKPKALKPEVSIIEKIKEKIKKLKERLKRKKEPEYKYEGETWIGG